MLFVFVTLHSVFVWNISYLAMKRIHSFFRSSNDPKWFNTLSVMTTVITDRVNGYFWPTVTLCPFSSSLLSHLSPLVLQSWIIPPNIETTYPRSEINTHRLTANLLAQEWAVVLKNLTKQLVNFTNDNDFLGVRWPLRATKTWASVKRHKSSWGSDAFGWPDRRPHYLGRC